MRVLTVAGKVDSRALVYPLARALSLTGLTAIVTDDGAYRRLFKGKGNVGNVSGIDISVGVNMDEELKKSLNKSGIPYDNLIVVSSNYIPEDSTGVILCHGFDDSMDQIIGEEKPVVEKEKPKKKSKFGKKNVEEDVTEEAPIEKVEHIVNVDDSFDVPDGIPNIDIFISFNKPVDKYAKGILLSDGYMQYIYSCEERKLLDRFTDKKINKLLAMLSAPMLDMETKELEGLLSKLEYKNNKKK